MCIWKLLVYKYVGKEPPVNTSSEEYVDTHVVLNYLMLSSI